MADIDFSDVNLAYLLQARDLARQDTSAAGLLLGISDSLARQFADMTPAGLVTLKDYKPPLVVPRPDTWWWERLLHALADSKPGELQTILEHTGLVGGLAETIKDGRRS